MSPALKKAARVLCYFGRHDRVFYLDWHGNSVLEQCTRCPIIFAVERSMSPKEPCLEEA